jgi:Domain of unknown function (DUF397)
MSPREWRKACNKQACVELAENGDTVDVRNSRDPGKIISFTREQFQDLRDGIKRGIFDDL